MATSHPAGGDGETPESAFQTIQSAIDAAIEYDIVDVVDGIYSGPGNVNLDYHGKALLLRSANGPHMTVIDCMNLPGTRGVDFHNNETGLSIMEGFGIIAGNRTDEGGAIRIGTGASPVIRGCLITGNSALRGGAIYINDQAWPSITECEIADNEAIENGGGIYFRGTARPQIKRCTVNNNSAGQKGAGVYCE